MALTILLANHHPIVRNSLRSILERETDFKVVAEAANGREAVALADFKRPDVVVLDTDLPLLSGIEVARGLSSKAKAARIVFVAPHVDEEYVSAAFQAGAKGYVAADSKDFDLVQAVRAVANGQTYISPSISAYEPGTMTQPPSPA